MRFTNKFPYTTINNINLDWIIKRVKELGETVLSYAQDIANAVALAEAAQDAADRVTGIAESAVTTAQAAEATANAIAGTANTALATAQAAETTAQAAETTANAIAGTANTALATAWAAETTAQAAETTAQAAEESAGNAESIAGTASANASNAVQTANTALATAQAAEATAEAAEATADIAETLVGTAVQTANTALLKAETALNEKAGALITTESGAVISFVPDRTIEQDLSINVDIEPVQAGNGDPSPDNVRPISGRNAVSIWNKPTHDTTLPPTVTIQLGQTVYGGTLDVNTGLLTITHVIYDTYGTVNTDWTKYSSAHGYYIGFSRTGMKSGSWFSDPKTMCDTFTKVNSYSGYGVRFGNNNTSIFFCNTETDYPTLDDWVAYVSTTHIRFTYPIDTPITIQLDPVTIATISGQTNNVWSDAGNVSVEFAADLKWYIDSTITELQALVLENGG